MVKNRARLDPARHQLIDLTESDWKSLFVQNGVATPEEIVGGEDIVLWYSSEVHRQVALIVESGVKGTYISGSSGTVFLHGIFFAHDAEKSGMTVGTTTPEYRPHSADNIAKAKQWFRSAD